MNAGLNNTVDFAHNPIYARVNKRIGNNNSEVYINKKDGIKRMQGEFENLLLDTQKEYSRSNRMKDKIIIVLIVLMFLEAVIGYCGFVWYESQFDYVTTEQTT